jgi:phospholipase D1/2
LSNASDDNAVKNLISFTIYQRIEKAIKQKEKFQVWILIPLIPGFAGELDDPEAIVPRVIMHWQYNTIYKGPNSLLGKIKNLGVDPS